MAHYTVQHSCGHSAEHNLCGSYADRARTREYLATQDCRECARIAREQQRQAQAEQAEADATEQGLPALTGSERQISWALTIRAGKLAKLAKLRGLVESNAAQGPELAAQMLAAIDSAPQQVSASWWIDRRYDTAQQLARELFAAQQTA